MIEFDPNRPTATSSASCVGNYSSSWTTSDNDAEYRRIALQHAVDVSEFTADHSPEAIIGAAEKFYAYLRGSVPGCRICGRNW